MGRGDAERCGDGVWGCFWLFDGSGRRCVVHLFRLSQWYVAFEHLQPWRCVTQEEVDSACPELVIIAHKDHTLTSVPLALSLGCGETDVYNAITTALDQLVGLVLLGWSGSDQLDPPPTNLCPGRRRSSLVQINPSSTPLFYPSLFYPGQIKRRVSRKDPKWQDHVYGMLKAKRHCKT